MSPNSSWQYRILWTLLNKYLADERGILGNSYKGPTDGKIKSSSELFSLPRSKIKWWYIDAYSFTLKNGIENYLEKLPLNSYNT